MRFIEEFNYDMNFKEPKIIIKDNLCIVENVESIIMIGDNSITVATSFKYVTVNCKDFIIKEIIDGRLLIEGKIQGIEIIYTSVGDNDRRIQNKQAIK